MLKFDIKTNFPQVQGALEKMGKQARFAAAVALTRTAQDVKAAERSSMERVFDRPTRYTLNSLYVSPAKKDKLEAKVWLKDDLAGSGTPATKFLAPQIMQGARRAKGFEVALRVNKLLPEGWRAVPGKDVKLDQYGNVSAGLIRQVLSQLKVQTTGGYESRATGSKRSNRTIRKQGVRYFVLLKARGKLLPGIWGRYEAEKGTTVKPVFIYVRAAEYDARLPFFETAEAVSRARFGGHFNRAFDEALKTAR
jgi:hypothetical protein